MWACTTIDFDAPKCIGKMDVAMRMDWVGRYLKAADVWGRKGVHLCSDLNLAYIETPKCASTTIKAILLRRMGVSSDEILQSELHLEFARFFPPVDRLPIYDQQAKFDRCHAVFSVVRNPYERLLSGYADKIYRNSPSRTQRLMVLGLNPNLDVDFNAFVTAILAHDPATLDTHWRPQHLLVRPDLVPYSHILRFESLDQQLLEMFRGLPDSVGQVNKPVRRRNHTGSSLSGMKHLTDTDKEMIKKVYRKDFELFGYRV